MLGPGPRHPPWSAGAPHPSPPRRGSSVASSILVCMTTNHATTPSRAALLLVDFAFLLIVVVVALGFGLSAATGQPVFVIVFVLPVLAAEVVVLGLTLHGARPIAPLSERSLLLQAIGVLGGSVKSAALLIGSGIVGAAIGSSLTAAQYGRADPTWLSDIWSWTLTFALIVGAIGAVATSIRGVRSLTVRQRATAFVRGARRLLRGLNLPLAPKHLANGWAIRQIVADRYLIWLPLALTVTCGVWLLFALHSLSR